MEGGTVTGEPRDAGVSRRRFLELAGISAALAACGGTPAAPAATTRASAVATAITLGKPEKTSITFGFRLPTLNSQIVPYIAEDKGFLKEVGINEIKVVTTEQVSAGLIGGGLDFGVDQFSDLADGVAKGLPTRIIGAYQNYTVNMIAVRPEIKTPKDLEGKDVLLAGTPGSADELKRRGLLKEAGFDLAGVKVNSVAVPGGSDAWVKLFLDGKLSLTPLFSRHRPAVVASGARLVVDRFDWGNEAMAATESFVKQNPNTVTAFYVAMIKALRFWKDLSNKDYILKLGEKKGFKITPNVINAYELDVRQYDDKGPHDGGFDLKDAQAYLTEVFGAKAPDIKTVLLLGPLNQAQRFLGITPRPML